MITSIEIKDLRIQAFHGALPQERIVGNLYSIDLTIWADLSKAVCSDALDDTINYAELVEIVQEEMHIPSNLLEHVCGRIVQHIQSRWHIIDNIEICVAKLTPPITADLKSSAIRLRLK